MDNELPTNRIANVFTFMSANIASVSAIFVIILACSASIFTYGYLISFSPSLLWVVDYTDMIKIGFSASILIIAALGFIEALLMMSFDGLASMNVSHKAIKNIFMALSLFVFVLMLLQLVTIYKKGNLNFHSLVDVFPALAVGILLTRVAQHVGDKWNLDIRHLFGDITLLLMLLLFSGLVYGSKIKTNLEYRQTIILDDRVIYDGIIVVITSEFVAIYNMDGTVSMFPKDRIRETRGRSNFEKSLFEQMQKVFIFS